MRIRTFGGLWIEGTSGSPALGPRRMALLALVAAAGRRGITRDRVIGILWPDAEEEQARHTLSQTLYTLKRDTGRDCIVAGPELRLEPSITSEIGELQEALSAGKWEVVNTLASGVFLDGFYLAGAPEFERWVEEERSRLQSSITRAIEQLASTADPSGEHPRALRWWTRLTELEPLNARYAAARMRALAAAGDRASALAHARAYEERVRRELDADVDPSIRKLAQSLRGESGSRAAAVPPRAAPTVVEPSAPDLAGVPAVPARRKRSLSYLLPVLAIAVAGGFLLLRPDSGQDTPFLAVGEIRTDPSDSTMSGDVLRDMLATSLGAIEELQVVANSRLVELMPPGSAGGGAITSDAARRAGASEVIEGEFSREAGALVLSLRRVALQGGMVRKGYLIRAQDRAALVDSAAAAIARDLDLRPPSVTVAEVRTSSPTAYALYEEGLRANFGYDAPAAYRLMLAALDHDSTFAMAAWYAWHLSRGIGLDDSIQMRALQRVDRLSRRTIERERLLLQGSIAELQAPLSQAVAIVESLAVKYPTDPDGQILLGDIRRRQGDYLGAVAAHERAFVLDSIAGLVSSPACRICTALGAAVQDYMWADSLAAAERTNRRLIALRGNEPRSEFWLVEVLLRQGRRTEGEATWVRQAGHSAAGAWSGATMHRDLIRWGRYEEVDRRLIEEALSSNFEIRSDAWWLLLLSLRDQGRLIEADTLIHQWRIANTTRKIPFPNAPPVDLALLATEMGKPAATIAMHRTNAEGALRTTALPALRARLVSWNLTLAGTAHAAAGDTDVVRRLADSVETFGSQSNWARDTRLHFYLRGLLAQMQGRHAEAVDAFRRAVYSPSDGFTRTSLMLARSLLRLGRGPEALDPLRAAIHGGVDGSNTYVSRTELHEALAQAFEMAGQADSARAHYAMVERSWRRADPQFRDRYLAAKRKAGL